MTSSLKSRALLARLSRLGVMAGIFLLASVAVLVVIQVAARNFLDMGLPWADELARFSCIGLVFIAIPCLAGRQLLVAVTIFPDALGPAAQRWTTLIADMATLGFCSLLLWSFAQYLSRAGKFLTPAMGLPNWAYYSLALIGTVLLFAIALTRVLSTLKGEAPCAPYHDNQDDSNLPI